MLSNRIYDILKYIAMIALPACCALIITLSQIWHFPYGEEIAGTIAGVNTFLGALLRISTAIYNKNNVQ